MAKKPRYTVEPGRQIYRDGQPFISVGRECRDMPADIDETTHIICALLNRLGKREVLTNYLGEPTKLRLKGD
jgi:hypothetical protein